MSKLFLGALFIIVTLVVEFISGAVFGILGMKNKWFNNIEMAASILGTILQVIALILAIALF